MRVPGLAQPFELTREPGELVLAPVTCRHVEMSHELIGQAALEVEPGRALILGAGACREIPLVALAQRFQTITLVDQDRPAMDTALASLSEDRAAADASAEVTTEVRDLTGLTAHLVEGAESCLLVAQSAEQALELLVDLVGEAQLRIDVPDGPWDLVIASCVLTQLHTAALSAITSRFNHFFPDRQALMARSPIWTQAMLELSWRLQRGFMDALLRVSSPSGRIYLSATVQLGMVHRHPDGSWRTPGWHRTMKQRTLAANLPDAARPLHGGEWPYVASVPTDDSPGTLFNVHAVIMMREHDASARPGSQSGEPGGGANDDDTLTTINR
ncbi:MAG: hypothetical protein AAGC55_17595 [Myxococcota bacterium]